MTLGSCLCTFDLLKSSGSWLVFLSFQLTKQNCSNGMPSLPAFGCTGLKHVSSRGIAMWFGDSHGGFGSGGHLFYYVHHSAFMFGD